MNSFFLLHISVGTQNNKICNCETDLYFVVKIKWIVCWMITFCVIIHWYSVFQSLQSMYCLFICSLFSCFLIKTLWRTFPTFSLRPLLFASPFRRKLFISWTGYLVLIYTEFKWAKWITLYAMSICRHSIFYQPFRPCVASIQTQWPMR